MPISESDLHQLVESIWVSMLDLPVSPALAGDFPADYLTSFVTISGGWQGIVAVDCVPRLARRAAGSLFGQPADGLDASQVNDALGELANIVGGNVKSLLPGPCQLGLPAVSETGSALRFIGCDVALQSVYHAHDLPFRVTVLHQRNA